MPVTTEIEMQQSRDDALELIMACELSAMDQERLRLVGLANQYQGKIKDHIKVLETKKSEGAKAAYREGMKPLIRQAVNINAKLTHTDTRYQLKYKAFEKRFGRPWMDVI